MIMFYNNKEFAYSLYYKYNIMFMKQFFNILFFIIVSATLSAHDVNAQDLKVSDVSCRLVHNLKHVGDEAISLYKEGSNLRIILGYYRCNPFMTGFDIKPAMREGNNGAPDSLSISIDPVIPDELENRNVMQQWYHVSFTIHGVKAKSVYLSCWWFEGEVELKESLQLKDPEVVVAIDNVDYYIYEAKHYAMLSNGKNAKGELTIPSEVSYEGKGYPVIAIKSQAFKGCGALSSITIPSSVTAIEHEAFYGCSNLNTINNGVNVEMVHPNAFCETPWFNNQPDGIVYFGKTACACKGDLLKAADLVIREGTLSITRNTFQSRKGLSSITIPEGITNIDESTFSDCADLVSVKLPESLTIIGIGAFYGCTKMTSIHLPSHVNYICTDAFQYCKSLTSIDIPEGVENMDDGAFYGCENLTTIALPESLKKIGYEVFYGCKSLCNINIPGKVEEIDEGAFAYCMMLNSLTLSEKQEYIGAAAFYGCSGLSTITCNAQVPPAKSPFVNKTGGYYSDDPFYNVNKANCKLYVPKGCEEAYRASELWKDFNIIEMGTSIVSPLWGNNEGGDIFDLQGRKLLQTPRRGIYIQNGKKVSVK